ncbi:MAG: flagellin, partial [Planctomycetes bacterium]|nr:flagellin [Planctomycetota bacterium]
MTFLPIGSSSPGLLNSLNRSTFQINRTLNRLATGLAIRRAADNPAGLIASENLRSQLSALEAASRNIDRAHGVLAVAETGLSEVGNLLRKLDGLVVAAANTGGMSKSERQALQLEADSILQAINRTGASTIFAGQRQLDGSRSFVVSDVSSQISAVTVTSSNLAGGESLRVDIAVTQAAERAQVALDFSGTTVELAQPGETLVFRVRGGAGEVELNVSSGTTLEEVTATINAHTGETGVEATVEDGRVVLRSGAYGGDETVTVEIVDDGQVTGATTGI